MSWKQTSVASVKQSCPEIKGIRKQMRTSLWQRTEDQAGGRGKKKSPSKTNFSSNLRSNHRKRRNFENLIPLDFVWMISSWWVLTYMNYFCTFEETNHKPSLKPAPVQFYTVGKGAMGAEASLRGVSPRLNFSWNAGRSWYAESIPSPRFNLMFSTHDQNRGFS